MRTSRPAIARCSAPSTSRFARSVPNARNRPVESSKSKGSGKRSSDIEERLVGLVGHALLLEIDGEPGAREHTIGCERRAPVRPAVADEHERTLVRQRAALALV